MQAEEDETPELPGGCDTSHSELYCVYTIQEGDTLSRIAGLFPHLKANPEGDYAPHDLLVASNKPDIVDEDDILQPGQKIRVPRQAGHFPGFDSRSVSNRNPHCRQRAGKIWTWSPAAKWPGHGR